MKGFMYIVECADGTFYTGSTKNLERRIAQHNGEFLSHELSDEEDGAANYTKSRRPVKLIYCEEYPRIDEAFQREKQVQGWNRKKKIALIKGEFDKLPELAIAYRDKKYGKS
jgi:putative endonuclease